MIFWAGSLIILLAAIWYGIKHPSVPLILIILGGVSNLGEKLLTGQVDDMLSLGSLIFNPADILIAIGVLGMCINLCYNIRNE